MDMWMAYVVDSITRVRQTAGDGVVGFIIIVISIYWSSWHTQLNYSGEYAEQ